MKYTSVLLFFLLFLRSFYALKNLDSNGYQYTVLHAAIVMYVFAFPVSQGFTFPWHVFINVFNNYICQNNNYIWILIKVHIISFCCFDFIHLEQVSRVIIWCFNVFDYLTSPSVLAFIASAADLFIVWGRGERWPYVSKCFAMDGTADIVWSVSICHQERSGAKHHCDSFQ